MIRVEKIACGWDVQVKDDNLRKEFSLVAAACMQRLTKDELIDLVIKAADHVEELKEHNDRQSKIFQRRFAHLMEINGYILSDMARACRIPDDDVELIRHGIIPSRDTLLKMAAIFDVEEAYFYGVENETD